MNAPEDIFLCMSAEERKGWEKFSKQAWQEDGLSPCWDCTPEFSAAMRKVYRCNGTPGVPEQVSAASLRNARAYARLIANPARKLQRIVRQRERWKERMATPGVREHKNQLDCARQRFKYQTDPEFRERVRARNRMRRRANNANPKLRERRRAYNAAYNARPEVRERKRAYDRARRAREKACPKCLPSSGARSSRE